MIQCDCGLTSGCKKCMPYQNPWVEKFWKEDVELAEVGMEEYNQELQRIDKE